MATRRSRLSAPTWAFLCRAGYEETLREELGPSAVILGEGVVAVDERPRDSASDPIVPAFATQAMRVRGRVRPEVDAVAERLAAALLERTSGTSWALQVVAPDSAHGTPRLPAARRLDEGIAQGLDQRLSRAVAETFTDKDDEAARFAQVWVLDEESALVGLTGRRDVLSPYVGVPPPRRDRDALRGRSGKKLEEALSWLGLAPARGEVCVDLGSGPGVWSEVAAREGARVLMVDRARPRVDVDPKRATHVAASPFEFAPDETADWLFVHLGWKPFEVARLVAKWGRRGWARQVIANFMLPMRKKLEAVQFIREILESGGWQNIRARHLLADGDEITIAAWLDPRIALRGPQAAFELRSRAVRERPEPGRSPRAKRLRAPNRPTVDENTPLGSRPRRTSGRPNTRRVKPAAEGTGEVSGLVRQPPRKPAGARPASGPPRRGQAETKPRRGPAATKPRRGPAEGAPRPRRSTTAGARPESRGPRRGR